MCDFINSMRNELNEFETRIRYINEQEKLTSQIYKILSSSQEITDSARTQWQADLHITIFTKTWQKLRFFNCKFSLNVTMREN